MTEKGGDRGRGRNIGKYPLTFPPQAGGN